MPAEKALTDPQITINNVVYQFVPNSVTLKLGAGDSSVDVTSAGNGNTDVVVGDDVSTAKGMLTGSVRTTENNIDSIEDLKELKGELTVSVSEGTFNRVMRKATIINDPDFAFTNDSSVEVQIEGLPFE